MANLWDYDEAIAKLGERIEALEDFEIPEWISDREITPADVQAICEGGCASGAYMPAVTYSDAHRTMGEHGDAVLSYLQQHHDDWPALISADESWSGLAVALLSAAVELWSASVQDELSDALDDAE